MIIPFLTLSPSRYGFLTALLAILVLCAVFISQYGFGLHPCTLCVWQRIPYAGLVIAGLFLGLVARQKASIRMTTLIINLLWLASFALGVFHYGVEHHWWTFPGGCSGALYEGVTNADDLLAKIKNAPVVRCDEVVPFLFGLSMAFYNGLLSFCMLVLSLIMTRRYLR